MNEKPDSLYTLSLQEYMFQAPDDITQVRNKKGDKKLVFLSYLIICWLSPFSLKFNENNLWFFLCCFLVTIYAISEISFHGSAVLKIQHVLCVISKISVFLGLRQFLKKISKMSYC